MGISEAALETYLRENDAGWILSFRALLDGVERPFFSVKTLPVGRPPYDPRCMLGLLCFGLICGVQSLRGLEQMARLNAGAWYVGRGLQPDHSTFGDFLLDHQEMLAGPWFVALLGHFQDRLAAARGARLAPGHCALDGSVLEAAASRHRTLTLPKAQRKRREVERLLEDEHTRAAESVWTRLQAAIETLQAREEACRSEWKPVGNSIQVAPSDLDAVVQPDKTGKGCPSYHCGILVEQHRLIVGQDVAPSSELDAVEKPLTQFQQVYGEKVPLTLLDKNYANFESLKLAEAASKEVLCPPKDPPREPYRLPMFRGVFHKTAFHYDPAKKELVCPQGRTMEVRESTTLEHGQRMTVYMGVGCESCHVRERCTKTRKRQVKMYEVDEVKERMRQRLREPEGKAKYSLRWQIVELAWGHIKERLRFVRFRRRGLKKVRMELGLWCIAYNLWRTLILLQPVPAG